MLNRESNLTQERAAFEDQLTDLKARFSAACETFQTSLQEVATFAGAQREVVHRHASVLRQATDELVDATEDCVVSQQNLAAEIEACCTKRARVRALNTDVKHLLHDAVILQKELNAYLAHRSEH
eukprot:TRINITY_DN46875_c0_g1_i1.p2 TRINITY_DN46875_c0_g1~~TRINITY_DN46875_c0_g1_i1.p2  ORF type:complete len:125 (-),score=12.20 TRINITY_DN46875_c0_g1_i1:69-443(-)